MLVLSGLSIPGAIALILLTAPRFGFDFAGGRFDTFPFSTFGWQTLLIPVFLTLLLGVPWLLGLVLRTQANAVDAKQAAATARTGERRARIAREQAEVDRGQAEEIAERRVNQARTAREVRDVVGHSLAVILEQAESAESLPEARAAEHRRALADIAFTARQSLEDVNAVLRATRDGEPLEGRSSGGMDSLIDRVRSAGYDVDSRVVGSPHPLPPERAAVALRVLEEMLTNAVKHGSQHGLVAVERHWDEDLRIEVRNSCADPALGQPKGPAGSGQSTSSATEGAGLDGMRRRLESVGGRLDVRRRPATDDSGDETFTATAWLPVES